MEMMVDFGSNQKRANPRVAPQVLQSDLTLETCKHRQHCKTEVQHHAIAGDAHDSTNVLPHNRE